MDERVENASVAVPWIFARDERTVFSTGQVTLDAGPCVSKMKVAVLTATENAVSTLPARSVTRDFTPYAWPLTHGMPVEDQVAQEFVVTAKKNVSPPWLNWPEPLYHA